MAGPAECPECGSTKSCVNETRSERKVDGWTIRRRRRECRDCRTRFTTHEVSDFAMMEIEAKLRAFDALTKALEVAIPTEFRIPKKFRAPAAPKDGRK